MSIVLDGDVKAAQRAREAAAVTEIMRDAAHGKRRGKDWVDPEGKPEGVVNKADDLEQVSASMVILCKEIADHLAKEYPGWLWGVNPQEFGGLVNIINFTLHDAWAYRIKVSEIQNDLHNLAAAKQGAGELLERFGMPRGPYNDHCKERLKTARRDVRGQLIPDTTDKDHNLTHAQRIERDIAEGRLSIIERNGRTFARKNW